MKSISQDLMFACVSLAMLALLSPVAAQAQPISLDEWADARLDSALVEYDENGGLSRLSSDVGGVLDTLIGWSPDPARSASFVRAFVIEQHAAALAELGADEESQVPTDELAAWLFDGARPGETARKNRRADSGGWGIAQALASLRWPQEDEAAGVYRVLHELRTERGDRLHGFPELVAALAVVFDRGNPRPLIEQRVPEPVDAVGMFDHLAGRSRSMLNDPARMPGELLIHVVDAPVSTRDLAWGLQRCANDGQVGLQYHRVTYDSNSLIAGRGSLKLDAARGEFGLPTVLSAGGVCRHQAFFAGSLGKSIGVPTVYVRANGPDMGHAWVGYLRQGSRGAYWDMSEGRWDDYEKLRGEIQCPQTAHILSDQQVGMSAGLYRVSLAERLASAAVAGAAERVHQYERRRRSSPFPPKPEDVDIEPEREAAAEDGENAQPAMPKRSRSSRPPRSTTLGSPRAADTETRFALLRKSVGLSPWSRRGWSMLVSWADDLSQDERRDWFDALHGFVGKSFPDVMVTTAKPMIASMEDPAGRDAAWVWLEQRVRGVPQLSLEIAVIRAEGLAEAGEMDAAWKSFSDAARSYAADGPFVLEALRGAERLLKDAPNEHAASAYLIDLYADVFRRTRTPSASLALAYRRASTHVKVGTRYARLLENAGRSNEADRVRMKLKLEP